MTEGEELILIQQTRFEGDISSNDDILRGAEVIRDGGILGADNGCVYAMVFNGDDAAAVRAVYRAKGRDESQTFALSGSTEWFLDQVDIEAVAPALRPLLRDSAELQLRTSGLVFVRAPLKAEAAVALPNEFRSIDQKTGLFVGQNWDPKGKYKFERLMRTTSDCLEAAGKTFLPGITSLNRSGRGEIVDLEVARNMAQEMDIALLVDRHARRNGTSSYPIVSFTPSGLQIARGGSIEDSYVEQLFRGYDMTRAPDYQAAKFNPLPADAFADDGVAANEIERLSIPQLKDLLLWIMQ